MFKFCRIVILFTVIIYTKITNGLNTYYADSNIENDCGPYGFACEKNYRVKLCEGNRSIGPTFICPAGMLCNEESTNVCENAANFINPSLTKKLRCNGNDRIVNPNVPDCKGYILCVRNGNHIQYINFKCSGDTIFNGQTRTCTSPSKYKCPISNPTKQEQELYNNENNDANKPNSSEVLGHRPMSIECKNYKFRVTQNSSPSRATYFCPPRPIRGQETIRCTIFSNDFCVTLEKEIEDQNLDGTPYRRPRM